MAAAKEDLYAVLGVSRDASPGTIRREYRKRAICCHPDKTANDPDKAEEMRRINHAYSVLSDPDKRRMHDCERDSSFFENPMFRRGAAGVDPFRDFAAFFGGGGGGKNAPAVPREPVVINVYLSATDVVRGCEKSVSLDLDDRCAACEGHGAVPKDGIQRCPACAGEGYVRMFLPPSFQVHRTCSMCNGSGKLVDEAKRCKVCGGGGAVRGHKKYHVKIPPHVPDGMRVTQRKQGGYDPSSGQFADLEIVMRHHIEAPYSVHAESGRLVMDVRVTLGELVHGFKRQVDVCGVPTVVESSGYFNPSKQVCEVPGTGMTPAKCMVLQFHVEFTDVFDGSEQGGDVDVQQQGGAADVVVQDNLMRI